MEDYDIGKNSNEYNRIAEEMRRHWNAIPLSSSAMRFGRLLSFFLLVTFLLWLNFNGLVLR
jgi:hypothetical protein